MNAADFVQTMLRQIKAEFFAKVPDKQFYQELHLLRSAITYPARWLKDRGGQNVTIGLMRKILGAVIGTIKKHGDRANIGRFSVYFLHCVQGHMSHHGDEYLQEAKRMPAIARFVPAAVRDLKAKLGAADPGAVLAETNRALGRGRRQNRAKKTASDVDLFSKCNEPATAVQKP